MTIDLKKFLQATGAPGALVDYLLAEKKPEDFDVAQAMKDWEASQEAVWKEKLKSYVDDTVSDKFKRGSGQHAKQLIKALGLDIMTMTEAYDLGFEEVLKKVVPAIEKRVNEAGKADVADLNSKLSEWQKKATDLQQEKEQLISDHEKALEQERNSSALKIEEYELEKTFGDVFGKMTDRYGVPAGAVRLFQENAKREAKTLYTVKRDGTLLAKDGKGLAVSLDGRRTYTRLEELVDDLGERDEVFKKSNNPPRVPGDPVNTDKDKKTDRSASDRMRQRFEQQRKE